VSTLETGAPPRAATAAPSVPHTPRRTSRLAWQRWISPVAIVVVWQLASTTGLLAEDELASPWRVLTAAVDVTASGELPEGLVVSLLRVVVGLALGVSLGTALGLLSGLSRWGGTLVDPPVQMLRTLPHLALVPLFILWFGVEETPKILLVALGVVFPIYLNVHAGVRDVDP
jgi:sulfonate transport system permease protein